MYKIFIFLLLVIINLYANNTLVIKENCFNENKDTINKWVHISKQDKAHKIVLPLQLIKNNIYEYNYSALMKIDKFKISNRNENSKDKQITYHAKIIETFKGNELLEIEFSKTIDIDEKICLDSTIVGHTLLISLEKHEKKYFGPDVGCVSSLTKENKDKLIKILKTSSEHN